MTRQEMKKIYMKIYRHRPETIERRKRVMAEMRERLWDPKIVFRGEWLADYSKHNLSFRSEV